MNNVTLTGRLTKSPELRYTTNGKAVCEFILAVNRIGQDQTDFITCVVWGKQAENLTKYQGKGSLIAVNGELRIDKYQTEKGENRYKTYVLCSTIEFLGTKKEENSQNNQEIEKNDVSADPFAEFAEEMQREDQTSMSFDESELPF